ncbi:MAG: chloride channel protein [Acidobacteria bacterium]|nr:MAG: chloride channel protein [Acidobacteriota bacterium]
MEFPRQLRKPADWLNLPVLGRWFIFGGLVGVVAGLGAIVFHVLVTFSMHIFLDQMAGFRPGGPAGEAELFAATSTPLRLWALILVPGLGGLLSGILVYTFAPEAEGHGTDSALDAYHQKHGMIRGRIPFIKTIASALTMGSGGSGGREGPIAQIGAGFGSFLARRLHLPERDRRILLAAGIGAGVGSIFRAPLAGALFAAEILYSDPEFESDVVIPAALSTIVAYCVFSIPFGFHSLFETPPFTFDSPLELIPYTILALVVALASGAFVNIFYGTRNLFKRLPIPNHFKPMLGGLATGLVGVVIFLVVKDRNSLDVIAVGYGSLQKALMGEVTITVLLALALGKILTTALTIGSGGSGGVFGPSMVIGGSLGGVVGLLAQWVAPETFTQPGAFVVVGMAGFFAAAANTPISTLVMVSEMTGSYHLLLPSLWVCSISYILGRRWNIYRSQVPSPFQSPAHRKEYYVDLLEDMCVRDVLRDTVLATIPQTASLAQVFEAFANAEQEFLPVIDGEDRCLGMISLRTLRQLLDEHDIEQTVIARDIAVPPPLILSPDDPATQALQNLISLDVPELPVANPDVPEKIIAMLARGDLVAAYNSKRLELLQQRAAAES